MKSFVKKALSLGEPAHNDVLVLLGHLFLHVSLESSQQEGSEDLVEAPHELLAVLPAPLHHPCEGVGEPLLELSVRLEDVGHEEVHE